jgi:hypothetical protein
MLAGVPTDAILRPDIPIVATAIRRNNNFKILDVCWTFFRYGLSCPEVRVNRPELTDPSIFIAQKIELFKEKMNQIDRLGVGQEIDGADLSGTTEMYTGIPNRLALSTERVSCRI